jgi:hypothetical protein
MHDDGDLSMAEKRVYADRGGKLEALVAAGVGVVAVEVSDDLVGGFRVVRRCTARDVAADGGRVAVATDDGVLVGDYDGRGDGETDDVDSARADDRTDGGDRRGEAVSFAPAGFEFGPAVAVAVRDGDVLAAAEDGTVARLSRGGPDGRDGGEETGEWRALGNAGDVRALDGSLVAAGDGVYRTTGDALAHAGLDDARDVADAGVPLAATTSGLYSLGNGWLADLPGEFRVVDGDGERAHAASVDGVYARAGADWTPADLPTDEATVEFGYAGSTTVAVTEGGTFLAAAGDGWRTRALGLREVGGLAVRSVA